MLRVVSAYVFVAGLMVTVGNAEIIRVPGDYPTIQAGIDAAQRGDEVVVADGVWSGPGNVNLNLNGKRITVRSENGPDNRIIDCEGRGRGFKFVSGEEARSVVEGFTIIHGNVRNGGAIVCLRSSPTIINCVLKDNVARQNGGGIYINHGDPRITGCTISGNEGHGRGGGIYCGRSRALIAGCAITGNIMPFPGTSGGMHLKRGRPMIVDCRISGNDSLAGYGGGIRSVDGKPTILRCTITENKARGAAGLDCIRSDARIINCVIANNEARYTGGGGVALHDGSDVRIVNCTISGNTTFADGGGLYSREGSSPRVVNAIIWGNTPNDFYGDSLADPVILYSDVRGGWPGDGNINADPRFVDPENRDYRLTTGSPCIDAGWNRFVKQSTTDLEDHVRRFDDPETPDTGRGRPPIVDMGAHEFGAPPVCTGNERLKARCENVNGVNVVKAKLKNAQPGARVTFRVDEDGETDRVRPVNLHGKAKFTVSEVGVGRHIVQIVECGTRARAHCR